MMMLPPSLTACRVAPPLSPPLLLPPDPAAAGRQSEGTYDEHASWDGHLHAKLLGDQGDASIPRRPDCVHEVNTCVPGPPTVGSGQCAMPSIGAGAIGGTVAAALVRDGHEVLLCDADPEHVAAINADGPARSRGRWRSHTVRAPAVTPDRLEGPLHAVLLAVKAHHTAAAVAPVAPLLAPDGFVVSLQNGFNEDVIAAAVGERARGRRLRQLRRRRDRARAGSCAATGPPSGSASSTGPTRARVRGAGRRHRRRRARPRTSTATCGRRRPTARSCLRRRCPTCRSQTRWPSPRYRPLFLALAREVLAAATATPEPFDGFDPADLEGSIDRLVEFNRHSAKTHSGIYRDLAVRHRKTEVDAMLAALDGPLVRRTGRAHPCDRGRPPGVRAGEPGAAGRLRAARAAGPAAECRDRGDRRARPRRLRPAARLSRSRSRTTSTSPALVTTNASTVAVPPPAARRRRGGRPRARGRRGRVLQDQPARVRRRQRQPGLRDDVQPPRSRAARPAGRRAARPRSSAPASATRPSAPTAAARSASRPPTAASSA